MSKDAHIDDLTATFLNKRVRPSEYSTRAMRHDWQACGQEPRKSRLKKTYERQVARRGTVTEILEPDYDRGVIAGLQIAWDDGGTSKCLAYMVEIAKD